MDFEAIFNSLKEQIIVFLKANIIRMAYVGAIAMVILAAVGATRATKAATMAKLTSKNPAVSTAEVMQLCSTRDLVDTLTATEDPNTPSTSAQNVLSATIRENAAAALNIIVAQKQLPVDVEMDNLFMLEKDADPTVKTNATAGLAIVAQQSDNNLQLLVKKLGDGDPDIRTAAANALGTVKGARAASLVAPLLKDTDASSAAQTALQNIGPDSIPYLIPMLSGASDDLRATVVTTTGNIGAESGVRAIVQQCNASPVVPNVHRLAILGLANAILKSYPPNPSLVFDPTLPKPTPRVIAASDTGAAQLAEPIFIKVLADTSEDNFARARAALALGRIGGNVASQQLVAALPDYDSRVVTAATTGLQEVGPTAVPELEAALNNSNVQVRIAAVGALGGISDSTSLSAISKALHDADPGVRQAAAVSLGIGGNPQSIALLLPLLDDPSGNVASAATESLHMIGKPAVPALIALLGSGNSVAALHASDALKSIGTSAQPAVLAALTSGPDSQRAWAAVTLGQLQDYSAEPQLQAVASGAMPQAKFAAQQALQQLGRA